MTVTNDELRKHLLRVLQAAGRPISLHGIIAVLKAEGITSEFSLEFVCGTILGHMRTNGVVMRRAFRTGRNIQFGGYTRQETVNLWFVSTWTREELNQFQLTFLEEMKEKRREFKRVRQS